MPKKKKTPSKTPEITITIENGAKLYRQNGILYRKDYLEKENGITKCCIIEEGTFNERSQLIDGKIFIKQPTTEIDEKFDTKSNEKIDKKDALMIGKIYRMQINECSTPIYEEGTFNETSALTKGKRTFLIQQNLTAIHEVGQNQTKLTFINRIAECVFETNAQIQAEEKVQTLPEVQPFTEGVITYKIKGDVNIEFSLKIENKKITSISLVETNDPVKEDCSWVTRTSSLNFETNNNFAIYKNKDGTDHKFFFGKFKDYIKLQDSELGSKTTTLLYANNKIAYTIVELRKTLDDLRSKNMSTKRLMPSKKDTVKPQETTDERSIEDLAREIEGADFVEKALKERKEKMMPSSSNSSFIEYSPEDDNKDSPDSKDSDQLVLDYFTYLNDLKTKKSPPEKTFKPRFPKKPIGEKNKKSPPPLEQETSEPCFHKELLKNVMPEIYEEVPHHQIESPTNPKTETASSSTSSSPPDLFPNSSPSLPKTVNFYEKFEVSFLTEVLHAITFILKDENQTDNHYNNSKRDYCYNLLFSITDSSRDNPISLDDLCAGLFLDPEQTTNLGDRIKNRSQQLYSEGITSFALERTVQMALQSSYNQAIKACMVFIVAIPVNSQQPLEEQGRNLGARV